MAIKVTVALALTCAGACLTSGFHANADAALLEGVYTVSAKGEASTWTVQSSCVLTCVAHVRSTEGWQGDANLSEGRWTMSVYQGRRPKSSYPSGRQSCVPGGDYPLVENWAWDAATLMGTVESVSGDECGGRLKRDYAPMALSRPQ